MLYDSLVSLAIARNSSNQTEIEKVVIEVQENITKLKVRSKLVEENFKNKIKLIEAEVEALLGNPSKALEYYKESIALSEKYLFVHEEALACERAGIYLLEQSNVQSAYEYLLQAHNSYATWGATAKVKHLVHSYPLLSIKIKQSISRKRSHIFSDTQFKADDHSQASVSLLTNESFCTFSSSYLEKKRVKFS